jgi:hypothetical protein
MLLLLLLLSQAPLLLLVLVLLPLSQAYSFPVLLFPVQLQFLSSQI